MKLSYDPRWLGPTGIGAVAAALIKRKPVHVELLPLKYEGKISDPLSPLKLGAELRSLKTDVFWSPGFIAPFHPRTPDVVTVHDLIHLHYYSWGHKAYYNYILKNLYEKCSKIITVSECTKKELIAWGGFKPEKIEVIYNAVEQSFNVDVIPVSLGYPYIFYAGNRRGYKNIFRMIEAYALSKLPSLGIKLLLSGKLDDDLRKMMQQFAVNGMVETSGFIQDEDLPRYYKGATAIVYISLYEGFGLPILEGMATGVPVITSDLSCMPEIAGGAALLVDPLDVRAIATAMNRIVDDSDLRASLINAGLNRAKDFSWNQSSEKFWNIIDEVGKNE
ncbi:glycosyltransferase family 1 protein [Janthinobacterium sp. SUN137]|uniref:glycosyltransferase family 4 protein n=1 Tax=Janthinobacterium sp. SUN137 TaxID=3014789 RepID=UPI002712CF93|nr:glycosyltransferase family 1 protein [Janthinobacterium sp. SUN137]MDO8038853.1 glycosyltransferase family 1 protein [Janthinobacterium sp. SUN137]